MGGGGQALRVQWPRRDRGLMAGAELRVRWRGGPTCHLEGCHHSRYTDPGRGALVAADGATDAAICSACMRRVLPIPSARVLEAARPAWDGVGEIAESAVLALVGLQAARRVIGDARVAHETAGRALATERFVQVDRALSALLDEAAEQRATDRWQTRVGDAAAAVVLAAWYDSAVEHWPEAAIGLLRERHPVTYESPAMSSRLREVAAAHLIGTPARSLVALIESLTGRDLRLPWADGPDRRQALDPLQELTQWGLVTEAEAQLEAFLDARGAFESTLGPHRCDLVAPRPRPTRQPAGHLELGASPNWLWQAVLAGFVGDAVVTAGSPTWDAASVPGLFRLALVGSGPFDPVDVRRTTAVDRSG